MKAPKSKYKGVYSYFCNGKDLWWQAMLHTGGKRLKKTFKSERAAARQYDLMCIEHDLEPVNILKRK